MVKHGDQNFTFDSRGSIGSQNILQSISDVSDRKHENHAFDSSEKSMEVPLLEDSETNFIFEPFNQTSSEKSSQVSKSSTFMFSRTRSHTSYSFVQDSINEFGALTLKTLQGPSRPTIEKTYLVNKRKVDLSCIPLPQSAASFYNGISPYMEVVEQCECTNRLNLYLRAKKDEVNAGVPGKFLCAVIGQDVSGNPF